MGEGSVFLAIMLFVPVFAFVLVSSGADRKRAQHARRLAVVERKLDLVPDHLGVEVPPEPDPPEVVALLEMGMTSQAVKGYRRIRATDRAEAQRAVDRIARRPKL